MGRSLLSLQVNLENMQTDTISWRKKLKHRSRLPKTNFRNLTNYEKKVLNLWKGEMQREHHLACLQKLESDYMFPPQQSCHLCNKLCSSNTLLEYHILKFPREINPCKCLTCRKTFHKPERFYNHIKTFGHMYFVK